MWNLVGTDPETLIMLYKSLSSMLTYRLCQFYLLSNVRETKRKIRENIILGKTNRIRLSYPVLLQMYY